MRRPIRAALLAGSVLALLSGCAAPGGAADAGTPAATPTPTAAATSTPIATPTPTPTAQIDDPADSGTWVIGFDTAAGIPVGGSIAAFARAAGLERVDDTVDCPPGFWSPRSFDGTLRVSLLAAESRGTDVPDPVLSYANAHIEAAGDGPVAGSPSTPEGIRLGSTEEQLLAAYPGIVKGSSRYDDVMGYTTYVFGPEAGRYLVFQTATAASGAHVVVTLQSSTWKSVFDVCD